MRLALPALAVVATLILAGVPVDAKPFPKTREATRAFAHDVLDEADSDGAKLLREAQSLVRTLRETVGGLGLPGPIENGALETRLSLAQPGIRGGDEIISAVWIGADTGRWSGAYWIETNTGARSPNFIEIDEEGTLLLLDAGPLAVADHVDITYHFLGVDGVHTTRYVGSAPMLDASPVLDHADFGAGVASARGEAPEILLVSPWNLHDRNMTLHMTLHAGDDVLDEVTVVGCADALAQETEPGCRLLYLGLFAPELTSISLWHADKTTGERVIDRALTRDELLRGYQFTP